MWENKNKAVTFSFDDGVSQDIRTIEILDKYGLKATFNLNSGKFGMHYPFEWEGETIQRDLLTHDKIREVYKNHEIASHTIVHADLTALDDVAIQWHIEKDIQLLSGFCDYPIMGMAYPCGYVDQRVAKVIKERTNIKYARTVISTYNFDLQDNYYLFNPTIHITEWDKLMQLAEKFINLKTDKPQLFYIWGHTYEFDYYGGENFKKFEEFCKLISYKQDIYYGTNKEVLLK